MWAARAWALIVARRRLRSSPLSCLAGTPDGCGHWGLLVVANEAQGTGVATALVTAAERRLAGACTHVQIEYDYTPNHAPSQRLEALYETKFGFRCPSPRVRRGRASQFRKCVKELPEALMLAQRPVHLRGLRDSFAAQIAAERASQPGGVDRIGTVRTLVGTRELDGRRGKILTHVARQGGSTDGEAGWEGFYIVALVPPVGAHPAMTEGVGAVQMQSDTDEGDAVTAISIDDDGGGGSANGSGGGDDDDDDDDDETGSDGDAEACHLDGGTVMRVPDHCVVDATDAS